MRIEILLRDSKVMMNTLEFVKNTGQFNFIGLIEHEINKLENAFQREKERKY